MRDCTNLAWPEGPFGADRRPFGKRERILMAVTLELDERGATPAIVAAAMVYLRTHRSRVVDVRSDTVNLGFRATAVESAGDEAVLLDLVDRALVRGRRHAVVLAGHCLGHDLARLPRPADRRLPGVTGVADAWTARQVRQRGLAVMVDTHEDVADGAALVDVAPGPVPRDALGGKPDTFVASSLARCIAIGLTAAAHIGVYRWEGRFSVRLAAELAAWDRLDGVDWDELPLQSD